MDDPVVGLVLERAELSSWAAAVHEAGRTIAFTNGCFDLIHSGHLFSLQQAAATADELVVALNGDESVRGLKGPGLFWVLPLADRVMMWIDLRVRTTGFAAEKTLTSDTVPDISSTFWRNSRLRRRMFRRKMA